MVSRETGAPPAPDMARGVFPVGRWEKAVRYADLLATDGVVRGLIGPRETTRLWERHLVNCAVVAEVLPEGSTVCDVGSGAGLPGVVLAIARPDLTVTLVEPLLRRTTFLDEVVVALELDNVSVLRARAEALHGTARFDVVTSRAVAPLPRLAAWCLPLVSPTGAMIAMKGDRAAAEIEEAAAELRTWGCSPPEIVEVGGSVMSSPGFVVRVAWADPGSVMWPVTPPGRAQPSRPRSPHPRQRRRDRAK